MAARMRLGFAPNATGREAGNGAYQITATGDVGIGNPFLAEAAARAVFGSRPKFTF